MKENSRNSLNQRENSRHIKWFSIKNPLLLVLVGLIAGIIISNIIHNEQQASKKLTRYNNVKKQQQQISTDNQDDSRFLTLNSNLEIINVNPEFEIPMIEFDHPSEDLNDQIQVVNSLEKQEPKKPFVFIFIGIISGRENFEERDAVRDAWLKDCNNQKYAKCAFFLSKNNNTNTNITSNEQQQQQQLQKQQQFLSDQRPAETTESKLIIENQKNGDMVFINSDEGYVNLAQKTLALFQYVAENYNTTFLLKTDDDAFVFTDRLHEYLLKYCPTLVCPEQKLFIGSEKRESEVILQTSDPKGGGKWENYQYYQQTGLQMYLPYMLGGGYVLSGSIVDVLAYTQNRTGLVMSKMEDATVGLWLGGMEVKRIDDSRSFVTMGLNCCFSRTRVQQHPVLGYFRLLADICRSSPRRVILHAVKNVTQMRYLGDVYRNRCKLKPVQEIV